ncbi:MAG: 50S ribosomal protein L21 [Candidatus Marinimicrobia bacterium]|nr:50S ribosomal protein L21 [Candidatus Neomarinimicrobiota bacterium]|tara:strand:+ start:16471 stop:16824 length:354 start_codon:yes stop_codon:yes gene_type:complete
MYAIIDISGKQFRVEKGHEIKIPHQNEDIGNKVSFHKVLLIDDGDAITVGQPTVPGFKIEASILSHGREKKVPVFKKKRRKGYRVKNTHRQDYTLIQIEAIKIDKTKKIKKTSKSGE